MIGKYLKTSILFVLFLMVTQVAIGQSFTLQGKVSDKDGNPIELASVMVVSQGKLAMTNLKGEFHMQLHSADSVKVRFSMIGYKSKERVLRRPQGKQTMLVQLLDDNEMQEVIVEGKTKQHGTTEELDVDKVKQGPSASGNAVEEMVQTQAGVSTHSELSSQYNVRGGTFDENSVYINNIEVYRPFLVRSGQQEGLSIINPDMVQSVGFSTGGFEAKYGDKMSSALDITYKRPKRTEASLTASLLGASAYLGIASKKFTWTNGVRYKTNRYLLGSLQTKGEYKPSFLDYQTYLSWQPSKRWQIDFIGNISDNHYNFQPEDRETNFGTLQNVKKFRVYFDGQEKDLFRTYFGSLSITRHLSPRTDVSLLASAFSTREQERYDIQGQYWLTQTETSENLGVGTYMQHSRDYLNANVKSLKLMLQHRMGKHKIEGGVTYKVEQVKENSAEYEYRDSAGYNVPHTGRDLRMIYSLRAKNELNAKRTEAYLQDTWNFQTRDSVPTLFTFNYGVRFAHWSFNGESIVSPRASLTITPGKNRNLSFRIAGGLYYQAPFYKELRDTSMVNGITYATLNQSVRSQRSIHALASMSYRFEMMGRPFKFTAEAYYKALSQLVPYSVDNVKVTYYGDQHATGHATGLDLKLFGEFVPGTDSWLTLSVMNTRMRLNGKSIPLPTDQRYALNLYFTDYFPGTTRWRMSLKLAYADGLPFATPHQELENNSFRAPAYKRADIGMSYRLLDNHDGSRNTIFKNVWIGLDCLNLFGINNVNSYYWVTDIAGQQYAVPNFLTGRQINGRVTVEF
ncbi:MAG: TonB-dependent receptor [Prevotella sp.]|uniref:TonB-dependent receptor n=1 Tax=Prevotella sp. TaxID=59823 RepID=UPI001CB20D3E|nr:TonB-dependent receptor [Prevotella sp.]MBF1628578.1 TonB-dependent receptor [Prevotella sp.]MBF1632785.1 TonB-dependent receptor [Prevotella sp.]